EPGMTIEIQPGPWGVWGYVALAGGVAGQPVMGSLSSHLRSGLGPPALKAGDRVTASTTRDAGKDACLFQPVRRDSPAIRYVPGPQDDLFPPSTHQTLQTAGFSVSARSDRMAYRLSGPAVPALGAHDIVSDGITMGAIQVPGDGQPFVLMADRQPTGGYPKIGTVIRADVPRLAQMRAGQQLRFQAVSIEGAVEALRMEMAALQGIKAQLRKMRFLD
ncbi:MAG: biotin-dependent carboxyltransferase family protein, partial [Paracoccaceae bacterium]